MTEIETWEKIAQAFEDYAFTGKINEEDIAFNSSGLCSTVARLTRGDHHLRWRMETRLSNFRIFGYDSSSAYWYYQRDAEGAGFRAIAAQLLAELAQEELSQQLAELAQEELSCISS